MKDPKVQTKSLDQEENVQFEKTAKEFLENEYKSYAHYVIENRAIPSYVDGFKPSQRKIAYAANIIFKGKEKPLKVFQLGGQAAALSFFHHGSLDGTIIGMTQDFKNSLPIFTGMGQFGSLRSPEAGAPRYIGVKFNENFKLLYRDFELCESKYEEGQEIEPKFFLPIVPTVLLNGGSGIAVGFATNILNRNPKDVIQACIDVVRGKNPQRLIPWINGFYGTISPVQGTPRSWVYSGSYSIKNSTTIEITEIPPHYTYEKYEEFLTSLEEKGIIKGYDDFSSDRVNYHVKMTKEALDDLLKRGKIVDTFKLESRDTENITTLDEFGKLRIFYTAEELLIQFVKFRLTFYEKRKALLLKRIGENLHLFEQKILFISKVISGDLKLSNRKRADIELDMEEMNIQKIDGDYSYLLSMEISTITREKWEDLQKKCEDLRAQKELVEKTTPQKMYEQDLLALQKKVGK